MHAVKIFGVLVSYSLACLGTGGIGLILLGIRRGHGSPASPGTKLATAFLLGQGLLASLWLMLSLAGWLSFIVVLAIVGVSAIGGLILIRSWVADFGRQLKSIWQDVRSDSWGWQGLALLTVILCLWWVTSIGRPLMGDATAFYMVLPKLVAATGHLIPLPGYDNFISVGLQGEMHYAAMMVLRSAEAAQLFAWPTMVAGAVLLLALGRRIGLGRRGQWLALAMVFTSSAVVWLSGDGKVDLFAAALGLAAYYWVMRVGDDDQPLACWLTGLFSGFAIIAKLSYAPVLLPGLALLFGWGFRADLRDRRRWGTAGRAVLRCGALILAGALLALIPHLLKNEVLLQNPIAPFGTGSTSWVVGQSWFGPETTRRIVLTYPLALTFGSYWAQYGDLSPLVLAFLPLALLLPRPRRFSPLVAVMAAALAGVVAWNLYRPSVFAPRYILATLLLFILLAARAAEHACQADTKPRWLTIAVMGSALITLWAVWSYFQGIVFLPVASYKYLAGQLPGCSRDGIFCRAMYEIDGQAEPGDRVFTAAYPRYWFRGDLIQCLEKEKDTGAIFSAPLEERMQALYQRGFRYLLADRTMYADMLTSMNVDNPPAWLHLTLIFEESNVSVYRLDAVNPPVQPQVSCRQKVGTQIWELTND
jgi:hypothetical protein